MGTQTLRKPSDAGAAQNPNRAALDDEYLTTEEASVYLREQHKIDISTATLNSRRTFGKAPVFLKISQAVRYRRGDLDAFARTKGLSGLPEREPERPARNGKK